jgi:hypothetical protein
MQDISGPVNGQLSSAASPNGNSAKPRRPANASSAIAAVLAALLVVLTGVLVAYHGDLPIGQSHSNGNPVLIAIDGIDRDISYEGNWSGYFGPAVNDSCDYCPVSGQTGSAINIPLMTISPPKNLSFWIFTNVSGPFLVQSPGCSPAPCTFAWLKIWTYQTFVQEASLASLTLFATFLLPSHATDSANIIILNATFCPSWVCPAPAPN